MHFNELPSSQAKLRDAQVPQLLAVAWQQEDQALLYLVKVWTDEVIFSWGSRCECVEYPTCVFLAFLADRWANGLDWLAEDRCRPLSLTGSTGLDGTRSCPGDGSKTQTEASARTNETSTSPSLCSCPALQCIFRGGAF